MSAPNEALGSRVALLRKAAGWTQGDVAHLMRGRGHQFQQQTVLKIEKGQRPLRLTEAIDLAALLGLTLSELVEQPLQGDGAAPDRESEFDRRGLQLLVRQAVTPLMPRDEHVGQHDGSAALVDQFLDRLAVGLVERLGDHLADRGLSGIGHAQRVDREAPPRRLVSIAEAASYLACSTKTIRRRIEDGSIVGHKIGPRGLRVDLEELDRMPKAVSA